MSRKRSDVLKVMQKFNFFVIIGTPKMWRDMIILSYRLDKLMYLFKKCYVWRHSLKEMFFKGLNVFVQDLMRDAIVKKNLNSFL